VTSSLGQYPLDNGVDIEDDKDLLTLEATAS